MSHHRTLLYAAALALAACPWPASAEPDRSPAQQRSDWTFRGVVLSVRHPPLSGGITIVSFHVTRPEEGLGNGRRQVTVWSTDRCRPQLEEGAEVHVRAHVGPSGALRAPLCAASRPFVPALRGVIVHTAHVLVVYNALAAALLGLLVARLARARRAPEEPSR